MYKIFSRFTNSIENVKSKGKINILWGDDVYILHMEKLNKNRFELFIDEINNTKHNDLGSIITFVHGSSMFFFLFFILKLKHRNVLHIYSRLLNIKKNFLSKLKCWGSLPQ